MLRLEGELAFPPPMVINSASPSKQNKTKKQRKKKRKETCFPKLDIRSREAPKISRSKQKLICFLFSLYFLKTQTEKKIRIKRDVLRVNSSA